MDNTKGLYQFFADLGRMGELEGVFIEEKGKVAKLIKSKAFLDFGEVLGKHSDIGFNIEEHHIELLSSDQDAIGILERLIGSDIAGYNPMDYWDAYDE
jgi:hypothetical protein